MNKDKPIKWSQYLPNALTITNMLMGMLAIFLLLGTTATRKSTCGFVLVGALADACDGSLARFLGAESALGKQLDSLADSITFGLAPAAILYSFPTLRQDLWMLPIMVIYAMAGCFRLARFNLGDFSDHFLGLPITAAGCMVVIYALLLDNLQVQANFAPGVVKVVTAILLLGLSLAMVSRVKIKRL